MHERLTVLGFALSDSTIQSKVDRREKARELWETQLEQYFARFGYTFSDFTFHFPPKSHKGSTFTYTIDGDLVDNGDTAVYAANASAWGVSSWHYHEKGTEFYFLKYGAATLNGVALPLQEVVEVPTWIIHNVVAAEESLLLLRTTGIRGVPKEKIHTTLVAEEAMKIGLQGKNALELMRQGVRLPLLTTP